MHGVEGLEHEAGGEASVVRRVPGAKAAKHKRPGFHGRATAERGGGRGLQDPMVIHARGVASGVPAESPSEEGVA